MIVWMNVLMDKSLWTIVLMDDCPDERLSGWMIVLFPFLELGTNYQGVLRCLLEMKMIDEIPGFTQFYMIEYLWRIKIVRNIVEVDIAIIHMTYITSHDNF